MGVYKRGDNFYIDFTFHGERIREMIGPSRKGAEKVIAKLAQDTGLFTVDFAQQPPKQPAAPRRPAPPKADADDAAKEKYRAEMAKFETENAQFLAAATEFEAAVKQNLEKLGPEG